LGRCSGLEGQVRQLLLLAALESEEVGIDLVGQPRVGVGRSIARGGATGLLRRPGLPSSSSPPNELLFGGSPTRQRTANARPIIRSCPGLSRSPPAWDGTAMA